VVAKKGRHKSNAPCGSCGEDGRNAYNTKEKKNHKGRKENQKPWKRRRKKLGEPHLLGTGLFRGQKPTPQRQPPNAWFFGGKKLGERKRELEEIGEERPARKPYAKNASQKGREKPNQEKKEKARKNSLRGVSKKKKQTAQRKQPKKQKNMKASSRFPCVPKPPSRANSGANKTSQMDPKKQETTEK